MDFDWDTILFMLPLLLGAYFLLTISGWSRHLRHPGLRKGTFITSLSLGCLCLATIALYIAGSMLGWDMPPWLPGHSG